PQVRGHPQVPGDPAVRRRFGGGRGRSVRGGGRGGVPRRGRRPARFGGPGGPVLVVEGRGAVTGLGAGGGHGLPCRWWGGHRGRSGRGLLPAVHPRAPGRALLRGRAGHQAAASDAVPARYRYRVVSSALNWENGKGSADRAVTPEPRKARATALPVWA